VDKQSDCAGNSAAMRTVLNGNNVRMVRLGRRPRQKQQKKKFGEEGKGKDEDVDGRYKDKNNGGGGGGLRFCRKMERMR